jgi:hypothetical protein
MKAITNDSLASSVRRTPVIALKHPSYQNPVVQAAAALRNLSEQYRLKKKKNRKLGHA